MEGDRSCHTSRQKSTMVLGSGPAGSGRYISISIISSRVLAIVKFICKNSRDSLQKTMVEREKGNYSDV